MHLRQLPTVLRPKAQEHLVEVAVAVINNLFNNQYGFNRAI